MTPALTAFLKQFSTLKGELQFCFYCTVPQLHIFKNPVLTSAWGPALSSPQPVLLTAAGPRHHRLGQASSPPHNLAQHFVTCPAVSWDMLRIPATGGEGVGQGTPSLPRVRIAEVGTSNNKDQYLLCSFPPQNPATQLLGGGSKPVGLF